LPCADSEPAHHFRIASLVPVLTLGLATADVVALTILHVGVGMAILVSLRRVLESA
jgi:hypothetical protein